MGGGGWVGGGGLINCKHFRGGLITRPRGSRIGVSTGIFVVVVVFGCVEG